MRDEFIPLAIFTDESSIACLAGFWGYFALNSAAQQCWWCRQVLI